MLTRTRYLLPLLLAALVLLQGCGFKLRTPASYDLPNNISPLFIQGLTRNDVVRRTLEADLEAAGIKITKSQKEAATVLSLSDHRRDRRITALDERGKAAEYELREAITFTLVSKSGVQMVPKQQVSALRTYTDTRDRVLGKESEAVSLRVVLRQDLAEQIMRRLGTQLK